MLNDQLIEETVQRLVAAAHRPRRAIVFGSYARGSARQDSDLDVLMVEDEIPDLGREMLQLQKAVGSMPVDVDILVYTEEEFDKRKNWCSTPVYWAAREGKVLYEHGE